MQLIGQQLGMPLWEVIPRRQFGGRSESLMGRPSRSGLRVGCGQLVDLELVTSLASAMSMLSRCQSTPQSDNFPMAASGCGADMVLDLTDSHECANAAPGGRIGDLAVELAGPAVGIPKLLRFRIP